MKKKLSHYFFRNPNEIGIENYLILILYFLAAVLGFFSLLIHYLLGICFLDIAPTAISTVIFLLFYLYCRTKGRFNLSKYVVTILSLVILNFEWFFRVGSSDTMVLYLFLVLELFIVILFEKRRKIFFTTVLAINVSLLLFFEYFHPNLKISYLGELSFLKNPYTGLIIYLFFSIVLINIALVHYRVEQKKAQLAEHLISSFLSNISHEIRTPMNGILGFAELLKMTNLKSDKQKEYIKLIEKSGARMLNTINDIIDISKVESGMIKMEIKDLKINEQIEYIFTLFKAEVEGKGVQFHYKVALHKDEAVIKTDSEKVFAILTNLIKNAIKYTYEGSIEFGYEIRKDFEPKELKFFVKDTGIGIPKNRQELIFERFIKDDISDKMARQGAGLGLSISKAYAKILGGKIWVESEVGKGSIFYFTMPFIMEQPEINLEDYNKSQFKNNVYERNS